MAPTKPDDNKADDADQPAAQSLATSRSRRQRVDKSGRSAALERFRQAKEKGSKNKYELEDEKNIYDVVEEGAYSDIVRQRQEDDWIVDDDGGGYVEDGREIFDDDMDEVSVAKGEGKSRDESKKNKNIVRPGTKPKKDKKDIKTMFAAAAASSKKKTEKDVSVASDDILGDLMQELGGGGGAGANNNSKTSTPFQTKTYSKASKAAAKKSVNPFLSKPETKKAVKVLDAITRPKPLTPKQEVKTSKRSRELDSAPKMAVSQLKRHRVEEVVVMKEEPVEEEEDVREDEDEDMENIEQVDSQTVDQVDSSQQQISQCSEEGMDLTGIDFDNDDDMSMEQEKKDNSAQKHSSVASEAMGTGWDSVKCDGGGEEDQTLEDVQVDSSTLPVVTDDDGKQVLRFYWLDAFEDPYHQPGSVYLFGKVWIESAKAHVSCCVTVKNIERKIYILPRATKMNMKTKESTEDAVTMMDVYQEFNTVIAEKHKITKFKSKKATKKYAFEKADVPSESDYLEVHYAADLPALPSDLQGETFSHAFGTHTTSLENFLLDRKMKGPCWLDLHNVQPVKQSKSWCKVDALVNRPDHVVVHSGHLPSPPLVVMTLCLRTLPNARTHQNEVVGAAALIHNNFYMDKPAPSPIFQHYFSVISKPSDLIFPYDFRERVQKERKRMSVEVLPTERALLAFLLAKIHKLDPDVIVGHDIYGFDLDIVLHRISANKVPHWSKLGRLNRTVMPKLSSGFGRATYAEKSAMCGRLLCDVKISARELIRCKSYDLTELTSHILHTKRNTLDYDDIRDMYGASGTLLSLVELTLMDSTFVLKILYELNVLPLALQITTICGNTMGRTLMGGRSERNEYLLLHAFTEKSFICPDKEFKQKAKQQAPAVEGEEEEEGGAGGKKQQGRRKPAYAGGLVLEPKKGFYDKFILLLDFNSLYPSIIQEYNICFTTITNTTHNEEGEDDLVLPSSDLEAGVLPTEIRKLVESRRQVKQLMKTPDLSHEQLMQYDIRQKALKLTANSMYGCLGFTFSRFYAKPLAALVTGKGREILMKTKQLVEGMGLEVIYGDTDSIMVNTNSTDIEQVFKIGNRVKSEVNKLYRLLEIDIDGVFKSMLLLKKKKYAALNISKNADGSYSTTKELKGLDIVRRDWCELAKMAGDYVVTQILSGEQREAVLDLIHSKLQEVGQQVRNNELALDVYCITKQLTKNPEDYPDKKNQSHVQVALRFNSKGGKKLRAGDTVSYVICEDGSGLSPTQRAYLPEEMAKNDKLKPDVQYYLDSQILAVVGRLCEPIEGTDAARLAECLGLDPSGYRRSHQTTGEVDEEDALLAALLTEEEKYRDCTRFSFTCPAQGCGHNNVLDNAFTSMATTDQSAGKTQMCYSLAQCQRVGCTARPYLHLSYLTNILVQSIRAHVNKYYTGWLKCDDSGCGARLRKLPLTMQRGHPICSSCGRGVMHQEYSDSALYTQLCFYQYIFDDEKARSLLTVSERVSADSGFLKDADLTSRLPGVYRSLRSVVDQWQKTNAYSQVNLASLFQDLFVFKQDK